MLTTVEMADSVSFVRKIIFFSSLFGLGVCYKPVIIIHGILDHASDLQDLANFIKTVHPGTNVTLIDIFDEIKSFEPLWRQIEGFTAKARPLMQQATDGIHIVGFSQGGLVARGMLETMPDHNVVNFVSLSAPQMGQYGDSSYLKPYLPKVAVKDVYRFFYTYFGQRTVSLANYWNDPYHQIRNLKDNIFLPIINNNKSSAMYDEQEYKKHKENLLKIKNMILIGGPDDGVITPWQSSQFGSYQDFNDSVVINMEEQEFFKEDSFGLKTLHGNGRIHTYTFSGIHHVKWHGCKQVFDKAIEPWLT